MRRYTGFILFFLLLMLLLPVIALSNKAPAGENGASSRPEGEPSSEGQGVDPADYEGSDFYLVQNHQTGEVMALSPADYIKGVVAGEMPISYHTEALKAQAVAAHSYALTQIDAQLQNPDPALKGAYLSTDSTRFQAYLSKEEMQELWGDNYEANYKKLSGAVDEVANEIVVYEDKPIIAAFHSISPGRTESAANVWGREVPYLVPVESEGDELSPDFETSVSLKPDEVRHALLQQFPDIELPEAGEEWFSLTARSDSGTVTELKAGNKSMTGKELRELLRLKSADFTVEFRDGSFHFTCVGYGHGVGMSQYGADYMARQGKGWQDILLHYYPGVSITEWDK